jgi:hypothetical protein
LPSRHDKKKREIEGVVVAVAVLMTKLLKIHERKTSTTTKSIPFQFQ